MNKNFSRPGYEKQVAPLWMSKEKRKGGGRNGLSKATEAEMRDIRDLLSLPFS